MQAVLVILTLREGADDILSRGANFSVGCVHGVKQQPVLVASLQHQRLTAQDGDAVPLWREQTIIVPHRKVLLLLFTCQESHGSTKANQHKLTPSYLKEGVFEAL